MSPNIFKEGPSKSQIDEAYRLFIEIKNRFSFTNEGFQGITESDTRAKFIDPIFNIVLGWHENDIRREKSAADGFADFVIGAEFSYFHIEAKRCKPQFKLNTIGRPRQLKIDAPHLLGQKSIKPHLNQTTKYSSDLGTDFAILTNGFQFIIYRTRIPGKSWKTGEAIVYHDWDDISSNFAEFYSILSCDQVKKGSLNEAFMEIDENEFTVYSPYSYLNNPDAELIRNNFWSRISHIISPYLDVDPSDISIHDEIIEHCYVKSGLSDQSDESINKLLSDGLPIFLKAANVKDIKLEELDRSSFNASMESDVKARKIGTYLLTGGVGSGKTTFLRRFARKAGKSLVDHYCLWIHIDFLPAGNINPNDIDKEIREYSFGKIREVLQSEYPKLWPQDGETIRLVFQPEIEEARLTLLHGVKPGSQHWEDVVNKLTMELYNNSYHLTKSVIKHIGRKGLRVVFILDNTDQLGEQVQESVFLLAQRLSTEYSAMIILALREEKFFAAFRRGLFDAYGDKRFHIGSPSLQKVLERRLIYLNTKIDNASKEANESEIQGLLESKKLIDVFINSSTNSNHNIVRYLSCISNGDMRLALGMFKTFISSGNTDTDKIIRIYNGYQRYNVPFHEFAKSAILGSRRYYRNGKSHVMNVFTRSSARQSSHFTALRLLARLSRDSAAPSALGDGYIPTSKLLQEYRQVFGTAEDLVYRGSEMLLRDLIESEPPRSEFFERTDAIRITASGEYYWKYLVRSFAYLDLIYLDTPLIERETAKHLCKLTTDFERDANFELRFSRVLFFLDYLKRMEEAELTRFSKIETPFSVSHIKGIIDQINNEIEYIKKKLIVQH